MKYADIRLECYKKKENKGDVLFCVNVHVGGSVSKCVALRLSPDSVDNEHYELVTGLIALLIVRNYSVIKGSRLNVTLCGLERSKLKGVFSGHTKEFIDQCIVSSIIEVGNTLYAGGVMLNFDWDFKKENGTKSIDELRKYSRNCTDVQLVKSIKLDLERVLLSQKDLDKLYKQIKGEGTQSLREKACTDLGLILYGMKTGDVRGEGVGVNLT